MSTLFSRVGIGQGLSLPTVLRTFQSFSNFKIFPVSMLCCFTAEPVMMCQAPSAISCAHSRACPGKTLSQAGSRVWRVGEIQSQLEPKWQAHWLGPTHPPKHIKSALVSRHVMSLKQLLAMMLSTGPPTLQ